MRYRRLDKYVHDELDLMARKCGRRTPGLSYKFQVSGVYLCMVWVCAEMDEFLCDE